MHIYGLCVSGLIIKASHEPDKSLKQSHETIELPNIEIVGKRLSHHFELPQIKEQAATAQKRVQKSKPNTCLFCENPKLQDDDAYEVTVNQLLKMQGFLKLTKIPESISVTGFYHSLTEMVRDGSNMCVLFQRAFPKMTSKSYELRKQDPDFIYDTLKLCEDCYGVMKEVTTFMKSNPHTQKHHNPQLKPRPIHPNQDLSDAAGSIQQLSHIQSNKQDDIELTKDMRDLLYSIDQSVLPQNLTKLNPPNMRNSQSQLLNTNGSKGSRGSFSSSVGQLVYSKITGDVTNPYNMVRGSQDSGLPRVVKSPSDGVSSPKEEVKRAPQTMTMMFSKVEAGKQVAESVNLF